MATVRRSRWLRVLLVALGALVVLVAAGLFFLDRILLDRARAEAAKLSAEWGRPVSIGGLATKIVPYLGAKVTGLEIGAAEGEGRPLFQLDRAEVHVGLAGALRSLGKDVTVQDAELQGLRVNVVRLPDGTTNVQRLAERASSKEPKKAPEEKKGESDLSFLRVDRASVTNARIAFVDQSKKGAQELAIDQLDVALKDLRAGKPLDVTLKAAVLAQKQNLDVRLHAAPLPKSLTPTPETLTVKLDPVALDPLAPFVPPTVGFLGGQLQADLALALGGAVPGGSGPTKVQGSMAARALRFQGQEGGKPLDVLLDADVDGDVQKGDARIGKLDLTVGPAKITGSGSASGLLGESPKIAGLQISGRGLDAQAFAAFYPPLRKSLGSKAAGPATFDLRAAGEAGAPALDLKVDLAAMRLDLPDTLTKAAGAPMNATARVTFPGGAGAGGAPGRIHTVAHADLAGVDLRPGGSIAKGPGDRLALDADVDAARAGASGWNVKIGKLALLLLADQLTAHGQASLAQAPNGARQTRFDLAADSARLDLDRLLLPSDAARKQKPKEPPDPATYAGLDGTAAVHIGEVLWKKAAFKNVQAKVKLTNDDLLVETASLDGLGGKLNADGTRMALAHPDQPMQVKVKLDGVDAGEALALYTPRKLLSGKVSANLDLAAGGADTKAMLASLTGSLAGKLFDGAFLGKDLVAGVAGPLAKALPFAAASKLSEGGATPLGKELPFGVKIAQGVARLDRPLQIATPRANLATQGGTIGLDGTLDVPLTVSLSPDTVAAITGGKAKPDAPIPVALKLSGPAWSPSLADLSLQPAVAAVVKSAGSAAVRGALGKVPGLDKVPGLGGLAGGQAKPGETGTGAAAPADAAQDARKKAEDAGKKALQGLFGK